MYTVSNSYKENIKLPGRIFDYKLIYNDVEIEKSKIYSIVKSFNTSILSTVMAKLTIETKVNIVVGSQVQLKVGVLNRESDVFEYLDYGYFTVHSSEYNAATYSYNLVCYDDMLKAMIDFDLNLTYPISVKELINKICERLDWNFTETSFINYDTLIKQDVFSNINYTFRDVLDELAVVTCSTIQIKGNVLLLKKPTQSNETVKPSIIKSTNPTFVEKYGPINTLVFSRAAGSDSIVRSKENITDDNRIEIKIADRQILSTNDRADFIDEMFEYLSSLEYYIFDIPITGLTYLEPCDVISLDTGEETYSNCLVLENEVNFNSGLTETIANSKPEVSVSNYKTMSDDDRKINKTTLEVDKQSQTIKSLIENVDGQTKTLTKIEQDIKTISSTVNKTEETVNAAVEKFRVNLDTNNIVISVNGENKPHTTTSYDINYDVFFMGEEITCKPITEDVRTGITLTIENNYIRFSVNKDTQIAALDNKYTFKFSYTDTDNNTYELYKSIIVCLALQGNDGADGQNGQDGADGKDGKESAIQSNTAPEDTSLMWLDTTTNQLKRYNGETWEIINDFSSEIDNINSSINDLDASVQDKLTNLENMVNRVITEFETKYTQTNNSFSWEINQTLKQIKDKTDELEEKVIQQTDYMRFEANVGLIIGKSTDRYTLVSKNNGIEVRFNNIPVSFWEGDTFKVTRLMLGNFAFTPRDNGSLDFGKVVN